MDDGYESAMHRGCYTHGWVSEFGRCVVTAACALLRESRSVTLPGQGRSAGSRRVSDLAPSEAKPTAGPLEKLAASITAAPVEPIE